MRMSLRIAPTTRLIVLLLGCYPLSPTAGAAAAPEWLGRWSGVVHDSAGRFHADSLMDLEIRESAAGLVLIDHDRQRGTGELAALTVRDRTFEAQYAGLWTAQVKVSGRLATDGQTLEVLITGTGMTGTEQQRATLHHADPDARRFESPRVQAGGKRVLDYAYQPPQHNEEDIPVTTAPEEGVNPGLLEGMVRSILAETGGRETRQTEGVLILRHGKLIFEEYFWGQTAENPHIISSCTKSVTAILAGIAVESGRLRTDAPVTSYFPEQRDSPWRQAAKPITVRDVLSMTSGTAFDDSIAGAANPSAQMLHTRDVTTYMFSRPVIHPAGTVYNYDNGLPALVGNLLARVNQEPLDRFAERTLFGPLGVTNYRWVIMPEGAPLGAGGMYLRPRDMAKVGLLMLDQGRWRGRQLVSRQWVKESTRQQTVADQYPYGYYWHLNNEKLRHVKNADGFMAIGQGGQIIAIFPALDLVVVVTSQNWAPLGWTQFPTALFDDFILPAVATGASHR